MTAAATAALEDRLAADTLAAFANATATVDGQSAAVVFDTAFEDPLTGVRVTRPRMEYLTDALDLSSGSIVHIDRLGVESLYRCLDVEPVDGHTSIATLGAVT